MSQPNDDRPDDSPYGPTTNLVGINIVFYALSTIIGGQFLVTGDNAIILLGLSSATLNSGFLWTPVTSIFTHSNIAHIGGNMLFLLLYGLRLEEKGTNARGIYTIYLATGIGAGMLSLPLFSFFTLGVGASGAVFGMLGYLIGLERRRKEPTYRRVLYASIILFIFSGVQENTNIFAHLFGLIIGFLLGNSKYSDEFTASEFV